MRVLVLVVLAAAARAQVRYPDVVLTRLTGTPACQLLEVDPILGTVTALPRFASDALPPLAVAQDPYDRAFYVALDLGAAGSARVRLDRGGPAVRTVAIDNLTALTCTGPGSVIPSVNSVLAAWTGRPGTAQTQSGCAAVNFETGATYPAPYTFANSGGHRVPRHGRVHAVARARRHVVDVVADRAPDRPVTFTAPGPCYLPTTSSTSRAPSSGTGTTCFATRPGTSSAASRGARHRRKRPARSVRMSRSGKT